VTLAPGRFDRPARSGCQTADFAEQARLSTQRELTDLRAGGRGDECDDIVAGCLAAEEGDAFLGATARRIADDAMTSRQAEAYAAEAALADAAVQPSEIDVVVSWSLVPD
jgi:hypothetical protein